MLVKLLIPREFSFILPTRKFRMYLKNMCELLMLLLISRINLLEAKAIKLPPRNFTLKTPRLNFYWRADNKGSSPSKLTYRNILNETLVVIDGYHIGLSAITLITALQEGYTQKFKYVDLRLDSSEFYNNIYRWILRYLDLFSSTVGKGNPVIDTRKVWERRYYYMDDVVPKWIRPIVPFVKNEQWEHEDETLRLFNKKGLATFGAHYRYPAKDFNNFASQKNEPQNEDSDK